MHKSTASAAEPAASARESRFAGRVALRRVTSIPRCADCGRATLGQGVEVRYSDGVAAFAGLASCGRVWLCPVCNSKVMARRALEVGAALVWAREQSMNVVWGSLTCWHNAFTPLGPMLDLQANAWRYVVNSRRWRSASGTVRVRHECSPAERFAQLAGTAPRCDRVYDYRLAPTGQRVGYIRAAELNDGPNGWHPHFHPIILTRGSRDSAQAFADDVVALWVEGIERHGGEAQRNGAQQLRVLAPDRVFESLNAYVTKQTYENGAERLALETVWSQGKTGRGRPRETVAHWSLLAGIGQGLADAVDRWHELERVTVGHRMITWSRGLRDLAGLGDEVADETVAAEELGTSDDSVLFITAEGWRSICDRAYVLSSILVAVEQHGWQAAAALLDSLGVEYTRHNPVPADSSRHLSAPFRPADVFA